MKKTDLVLDFYKNDPPDIDQLYMNMKLILNVLN